MKEFYDAIVIGTGFGGAVAACRLSQAGLKVGVVERGRRYPAQGFPRDSTIKGRLWSVDQGLFDLRQIGKVLTVQAAGLGGGSLVYSNVHLRAPQFVFESGWPKEYSRAALDRYYDLVGYMLDLAPITAVRWREAPPKTHVMQRAAGQVGGVEKFCYPNLAIDFSEPGVAHKNKFGVEQQGCNYCGECTLGCNVHAKNTLDLNYLALAERHGADIAALCEVFRIEPLNGGYRVCFKDHAAQSAVGSSQARAVFLCAGAVNSTELLLRCRDQFRTLPNLSDALGRRCSLNGDFVAFAFGTAEPFEPWNGPIITTALSAGDASTWFVVQEGGCAKEVGPLIQLLDRNAFWLRRRPILALLALGLRALLARPTTRWSKWLAALPRRAIEAAIRWIASSKQPASDAAVDHTAPLLVMGYDHPTGVLKLSPITRRLRSVWEVAPDIKLYRSEERLCAELARAMGARLRVNPFFERLHHLGSVHTLGGCGMAERKEVGVTNPDGEVYGYPNLYVLDGAALPASTGVNPASTIAAVAERNIERAIRKLAGLPAWQAPELAAAPKLEDPLTS